MNYVDNRYFINKIGISNVNLATTLTILENYIKNKQYGYICVSEERTAYIANHNAQYCSIQNNSLLTVPDGMPLVWIAHNMGFKKVGRVSGPDLLDEVLKISNTKGYSHYFYGSTLQTINLIKNKLEKEFPLITIKGAVSPPFQKLEFFNIEELAIEINELKPTFFWCGLGAPKQENLIALLQPKLQSTICIGVGLAFEYFSDNVKRAPKWAQKIGFEGFFRLYQQPERINFNLLIRYLYWIKKILVTKIIGNSYTLI